MASETLDDGPVQAHITPAKVYVGIFAALIVLTLLMVKIPSCDCGAVTTVAGVVIATLQASLVTAFFMHLSHGRVFNTLTLLAAFFLLGIFLLLTHEDLANRGRVSADNGTRILPRTGEWAPGGMSSADRLPPKAPAP
ncbi:MAG: cytochrome C oxidase subunit IV family protein [Myxococcales bacterium]